MQKKEKKNIHIYNKITLAKLMIIEKIIYFYFKYTKYLIKNTNFLLFFCDNIKKQ